MYDAISIGHKKTGTSTAIISSGSELTQKDLEKILGDDIPILSFNRLK